MIYVKTSFIYYCVDVCVWCESVYTRVHMSTEVDLGYCPKLLSAMFFKTESH